MYPIKDNLVVVPPESIMGIDAFLADAVQREFEDTNLCEEVDTFWLRIQIPTATGECTEDKLQEWRTKLSVTLQRIPVPFIVQSLIIDDQLADSPEMLQLRGLILFHGLDPFFGE